MSAQTPTLAQVIQNAIEARLTGLHTLLPGKVVAVNLAQGKCDVQPLIQRIGPDGQAITLPVITNCPIGFYRAGKAAVYLPLAIGHNVEIRFCERSLDIWLTKGGTVDPSDARKHNLSDAVVYPGLYDFNQPPTGADASDLVIINDKSSIRMSPNGTFKFKGINDELLTCVSDLIGLLETVRTETMLGPNTFLSTDVAALAAIKARVDGMKES